MGTGLNISEVFMRNDLAGFTRLCLSAATFLRSLGMGFKNFVASSAESWPRNVPDWDSINSAPSSDQPSSAGVTEHPFFRLPESDKARYWRRFGFRRMLQPFFC